MSSQEEVRLPPLPSAFRFNDAGFACISAAFLDELRRLAVISDRAARAQPAQDEREALTDEVIASLARKRASSYSSSSWHFRWPALIAFTGEIASRVILATTAQRASSSTAVSEDVRRMIDEVEDQVTLEDGVMYEVDAQQWGSIRTWLERPIAPDATQEAADAKGEDARDAARLDFIEREWFYRDTDGSLCFGFNETWSACNGKRGVTLREAIDAALQSDRAREDR